MKHVFLALLLALTACNPPAAEKGAPPAAPPAATAPAQEPQDRDVKDPVPTTGRISGELGFPSDFTPTDMQVVAVPVTGGASVSNAQKNGDKYTMELPVGEYYVYAITSEDPGRKAYYNEFVTCGLNVNCPSHMRIKVPVRAGQTTPNVNPVDWYEGR